MILTILGLVFIESHHGIAGTRVLKVLALDLHRAAGVIAHHTVR